MHRHAEITPLEQIKQHTPIAVWLAVIQLGLVFFPVEWKVALSYDLTEGPTSITNVLRLFSCTMMHAGWGHYFYNTVTFLPPAVYFETVVGRKWFTITYFAAGAVAALTQHLSFLGGGYLLGSSGAGFGMIGAALACYMLRGGRFGLLATLIIGVHLFVMSLIGQINILDSTAHLAHFGGACFGFLAAVGLHGKSARPSSKPRSKRRRANSRIRRILKLLKLLPGDRRTRPSKLTKSE